MSLTVTIADKREEQSAVRPGKTWSKLKSIQYSKVIHNKETGNASAEWDFSGQMNWQL